MKVMYKHSIIVQIYSGEGKTTFQDIFRNYWKELPEKELESYLGEMIAEGYVLVEDEKYFVTTEGNKFVLLGGYKGELERQIRENGQKYYDDNQNRKLVELSLESFPKQKRNNRLSVILSIIAIVIALVALYFQIYPIQ